MTWSKVYPHISDGTGLGSENVLNLGPNHLGVEGMRIIGLNSIKGMQE